MALSDKIQKASNPDKSYFITIYGAPGVGKTVLSATAPNALILDFEHGTKSLATLPKFAETDVLVCSAVSDIDSVVKEHRAGKLTYSTYVIDTISELQRLDLDQIETSGDASKDFRQDAQRSNKKIRRRLLELRDLKVNVIVTCHAILQEDELKGYEMIRPAVTPGLFGTVHSMSDLLVYLEVDGKGNRKATTMPTRRIQAKNRLGSASEILDPTWETLLK